MKQVATTRTANIDRTAEGIVITRVRKDAIQVVTDAVENIAVSSAALGGVRGPIVVDLRDARPIDAETRHYYSGKHVSDNFSALAILVPIGAFGQMMGNLYLRVAKLTIPTRLFREEAPALEWLRAQLPERTS